ncbi:hypothetical protein B0T22DRAFT_447808 [Podospora appendiculata]|uniref:Uncharacterized protein n=1 Tax=Podospora appendiculata TaxID=314037 RepID=A0AAE0XFT0_9PEZI|nr:hypothetical protein B0T22DRAFT_447808 [Podospora appendiculata]
MASHQLVFLRCIFNLPRPSLLSKTLPLALSNSSSSRHYHPTPRARLPYKDDQDRTSLKPRPSEGTKSGSDSDVANLKDAFNPKMTNPEEQMESSAREPGGGALDASGGNQIFSKPFGDKPGGLKPDREKDTSDKKRRTGGSSGGKAGASGPKKHGKVNP